MKPRAQILIVEDESILYEKLRRFLSNHNFSVDEYTKSYEEAIERISSNHPDLVLLDIDLQGEKSGLDLGKVLTENYRIPFIYVTNYRDDFTFYKALDTQHEHYLVKTKPRIDTKSLLRTIETVLHKNSSPPSLPSSQGLIGLTDYLLQIKEKGEQTLTKIPIDYTDIVFISTHPNLSELGLKESLKPNYVWFKTSSQSYFLHRASLKELESILPSCFIRISDHYIVNLSSPLFNGLINNSRLSICDQFLWITDTYSSRVKAKLKELYKS